MITIRICRTERETGRVEYKDYRCTTKDSLKIAMEQIRDVKLNNDLLKYEKVEIVDIFETR